MATFLSLRQRRIELSNHFSKYRNFLNSAISLTLCMYYHFFYLNHVIGLLLKLIVITFSSHHITMPLNHIIDVQIITLTVLNASMYINAINFGPDAGRRVTLMKVQHSTIVCGHI